MSAANSSPTIPEQVQGVPPVSYTHLDVYKRQVIGRRVVVPKILALFGKAVSGLLRDADLNAVADISRI